MKKPYLFLLILLIVSALAAAPVFASVAEAGQTVTEGAVEFPTGLLKLVGGTVWLIGEVIALPFRIIF
jgi:hypothetical protein